MTPRRPVVKIKESAIERALVARVHALGGMCVKVAARGQRGFFDCIVFLPGGVVCFCELKRPRGGRLSPHQRQYAARLTALGAVACVIWKLADIDVLLGPHAV
jgi:hypothetical protein